MAVIVLLILQMKLNKKGIKRRRRKKHEKLPTLQEINRLRKKEDLVKVCGELGIPVDGNKKRLKKRLVAYVEMRQREIAEEFAEEEERERAREDGRAGGLMSRLPGLGARRRYADDGAGAEDLPNLDYGSVQLAWDDGWFSSDMISFEELMELGLVEGM